MKDDLPNKAPQTTSAIARFFCHDPIKINEPSNSNLSQSRRV
jgi:hypothetical protein